MSTRFYSAFAALAMSTAIAGSAMAADTARDGKTGVTQTAASQSRYQQYRSQAESRQDSAADAAPRQQGDNLGGVNGVKVGSGPGYAWWKDR